MAWVRLLGLIAGSIGITACDSGPPETAAPAGGTSGPGGVSVRACDRLCLIGFTDRYLDAVVAHDAARLPLASTIKYTENAQRLALDDGLWATASTGAKYRLDFADADTGQVGVFALIEESGQPSLIGARMKVANGLIEEIETVVVRGGEALLDSPVLAAPRPAFHAVEEPARSSSREELFAIADRYFEALEKNLAGYVQFDERCQRVENGIQTTGNTQREPFPTPEFNVRAMGCQGNVDSRTWTYITKISPRRFLIADPERGLAFGVFMFHHSGTIESFTVPGVGTFENTGARRRPFTTVIPELFKIRDGKIVAIEAVMATLPYGSQSGWD